MTSCTRCGRRLTGFFSSHVGIGPSCARRIQRERSEAVEKAMGRQADLFEGELAVADLAERARALLARIGSFEARVAPKA